MSKADAGFSATQIGSLPGLLGFDWIEVRAAFARGRFDIGKQHLALNGYLHAATVVALADTACGYGCVMSLPQGASGFTTAELKANFIGTAREGGVVCDARLVHGGRTPKSGTRRSRARPTARRSLCSDAPRSFSTGPGRAPRQDDDCRTVVALSLRAVPPAGAAGAVAQADQLAPAASSTNSFTSWTMRRRSLELFSRVNARASARPSEDARKS